MRSQRRELRKEAEQMEKQRHALIEKEEELKLKL